MEQLNNVFINVHDYSLLKDRKLFSQPHVKLRRLCENLQRQHWPKVGWIPQTNDSQTGVTESKIKCENSFPELSETKAAVKQTAENCKKERLENEPADSPSPSADYRPLKFVSDQMLTLDSYPYNPMLTSDSHPYNPMLTSDSHPYNPMLTSDSHPYNPMLTSDSHPYNPMLTSDSNPLDPLLTSDSHPQSSLIIETKDFFENISKEAQPDNSNVSNMNTGGHSPSLITHALVDVLGKTVIPPFSFKECAESNEVNCPTGIEIINFSTEDSLGHSRNHDSFLDNDGECGAVGDENYGVILVVKPEKDEDTSDIMISNVESIENAMNNNDVKDEVVNKDANCIKTKLDVHKAVSDNVRQTRSSTRKRNVPSFLQEYSNGKPLSSSNAIKDNGGSLDGNEHPTDGECEPTDGDSMPSRKNTSTDKLLQQTGIPRQNMSVDEPRLSSNQPASPPYSIPPTTLKKTTTSYLGEKRVLASTGTMAPKLRRLYIMNELQRAKKEHSKLVNIRDRTSRRISELSANLEVQETKIVEIRETICRLKREYICRGNLT